MLSLSLLLKDSISSLEPQVGSGLFGAIKCEIERLSQYGASLSVMGLVMEPMNIYGLE